MQLQSINNEEKLINQILFLYISCVAVLGWAFVMIFFERRTAGVYIPAVRSVGDHHKIAGEKSGAQGKIRVRLYPADRRRHHSCRLQHN